MVRPVHHAPHCACAFVILLLIAIVQWLHTTPLRCLLDNFAISRPQRVSYTQSWITSLQARQCFIRSTSNLNTKSPHLLRGTTKRLLRCDWCGWLPLCVSLAAASGSYMTLMTVFRTPAGRSHDIDGTMPYALSTDGGHVWSAKKSSFTGIHGGEREVMIRLGSIDQPLMHCTPALGRAFEMNRYLSVRCCSISLTSTLRTVWHRHIRERYRPRCTNAVLVPVAMSRNDFCLEGETAVRSCLTLHLSTGPPVYASTTIPTASGGRFTMTVRQTDGS